MSGSRDALARSRSPPTASVVTMAPGAPSGPQERILTQQEILQQMNEFQSVVFPETNKINEKDLEQVCRLPTSRLYKWLSMLLPSPMQCLIPGDTRGLTYTCSDSPYDALPEQHGHFLPSGCDHSYYLQFRLLTPCLLIGDGSEVDRRLVHLHLKQETTIILTKLEKDNDLLYDVSFKLPEHFVVHAQRAHSFPGLHLVCFVPHPRKPWQMVKMDIT